MEAQWQFPNQMGHSTYNTTPLFTFNPDNYPYTLTYQQPTNVQVQDGEVFLKIDSKPTNYDSNCPTIQTPTKLPTYLEENLGEVNFTLATGCFCRFKNCLDGLEPEMVYRHRNTVSKLSKEDHNMFLMGAIATCMAKTTGPAFRYIKYTFRGKRVCKEAFLYLQCCTHQQIMQIRDHLTAYGVSHMTQDSVKNSVTYTDGYKHLRGFLERYMECHVGKENVPTDRGVFLPLGTTKKSMHESYKAYMEKFKPGVRYFSFNTFSSILNDHFPHIIFCSFGRNVLLRQVQVKDEKVECRAKSTIATYREVPYEDKKFSARI